MAGENYQWRILQEGTLPLKPTGTVVPSIEHVCTTTLVWPEDQDPNPENSLIVDPCFSWDGWRNAQAVMASLGASMDDVGYCHITHLHPDHCPDAPVAANGAPRRPFKPNFEEGLPSVSTERCPGHHPTLEALRFETVCGEVWIVGDAILDADWLRNWSYYWPNRYNPSEIVETWRSVAKILSSADVVIPGHGAAISVSPDLLDELCAAFPQADLADRCPEVKQALRRRYDRLRQSSREDPDPEEHGET